MGLVLGENGDPMEPAKKIPPAQPSGTHVGDLTNFLDTLRDGVVVVGPDMRVKSYNASYLDQFDLGPDDISVGEHMSDVLARLARIGRLGEVTGDIDAKVAERLAAWGGEEGRVERRYMQSGRVLDIYRSHTTDDDIVSVHVDVTDAVQSASEVERQRLYMKSLLENTSDGITLLDKNGNFAMFNEQFLNLYDADPDTVYWGIPYRDMIAQFGDIQRLSGKMREREIELRTRFAFDASIANIRRRLGDGRTLNINKTLLPDGGCVMTIRDMTEELTREQDLLVARHEAEASSRHKSEFVARMSHEMRTPLNGILGVAALMKRTEMSEKQAGLIDVISASGKVLLRLIDDILDLSRLEAETFEVVEDRFEISELIEQCMGIIAPGAEEKGLELRLVGDVAAVPALLGDMVRIKQILLNLLTNSVKFTETGYIAIELDSEIGPEGVTISISIVDTGVGIAEDKLDQIFNRFYQIDGTVTRKYGGAGLGLAIARKLVDAMGGAIQVASSLGEGTTFRIRLTLPEAKTRR